MTKDAEREAIIIRLVALLRARQKERGLSLNETAWRADLNHTMVLRVERRDRTPTIDTLLRLTEALKSDLAQLLAEALHAGKEMPTPEGRTGTARKRRRRGVAVRRET